MNTDTENEQGTSIDYEPADDVYRMQVEPGDSVAVATVELVGTVVDRDPVDLPPIHGRIDTDALDSLFQITAGAPDRTRGFVEFSYVGCRVRIYADGEVVVRSDGVV